nr:hypothetical protein [Marinicella sp. W31]MDC2875543.1 hypothetical protein [Marinicella sp. W31]
MSFRLERPDDFAAVHELIRRAFTVWLPVLGYPPRPVTEDHAPRIFRGEVLLVWCDDRIGGVVVVKPGPSVDLIYSVAINPDFTARASGAN